MNNCRGAESVVQVTIYQGICVPWFSVFFCSVQLVSPKISWFPLTFKAALEIQRVKVVIVPPNRKSLLSRSWQAQAQLFLASVCGGLGHFPFLAPFHSSWMPEPRFAPEGSWKLWCAERDPSAWAVGKSGGSQQQGNCSVQESELLDITPEAFDFGKKCHCLWGLLPWGPSEGIGTDQSVKTVQAL